MSLYSEDTPTDVLKDRIRELQKLIDDKHSAIDSGEIESNNGHKASITRWETKANFC